MHKFLVELRDVFRLGGTASIHYHFNLVLAHQRKPSFDRMVGVAESVKATHLQGIWEKDSTYGG
jgi:hypothetical protein